MQLFVEGDEVELEFNNPFSHIGVARADGEFSVYFLYGEHFYLEEEISPKKLRKFAKALLKLTSKTEPEKNGTRYYMAPRGCGSPTLYYRHRKGECLELVMDRTTSGFEYTPAANESPVGYLISDESLEEISREQFERDAR